MSQPHPPLIPPQNVPEGSASLFPSDHMRMLVELLRPATPELARRWLAALLVVPAPERAGVVTAVERQIITTYDHGRAPEPEGAQEVDVVHPSTSRDGYIEQVVVTYAPTETKPAKRRAKSG